MHRVNGTEDGYELRIDPTKKLVDAKRSMLRFIERMNEKHFTIPSHEMNRLAHVDAAIDELLDVYHKIVVHLDDADEEYLKEILTK